jgi:hypothetical protein
MASYPFPRRACQPLPLLDYILKPAFPRWQAAFAFDLPACSLGWQFGVFNPGNETPKMFIFSPGFQASIVFRGLLHFFSVR